jgi:hypothetical protein
MKRIEGRIITKPNALPPIFVSRNPLMSRKTYKHIAEKLGFDANFQDIEKLDFDGFTIYLNGCYGHRHWIAVKSKTGRIHGLTVGHSGWMVERPFWEQAGFITKLIEVEHRPYPVTYLQIVGWKKTQTRSRK